MKKEKIKINSTLIIGIIFFTIGIGIFSYPAISNFLAEKNQTKAIDLYTDKLSIQDQDKIDREFYRAEIYNENILAKPVYDPFSQESKTDTISDYNDVLNFDGMMGYIEIPKIAVKLPIYHGTGEDAMKRGVGHISSTSLPIGGNSTHTVLTSHTGLPSAELFTRLDEIKENDYFFITVLNRTITYKVTGIDTVLPTEMSSLQITKDKDLATLVTCTPYGVNSHRLLVHGERTFDNVTPEDIKQENKKSELFKFNYGTLGIATILVLVIIGLIFLLIYISAGAKKEEE